MPRAPADASARIFARGSSPRAAGASSVSRAAVTRAASPKCTETNGISRPPDFDAASRMYAFVSSISASRLPREVAHDRPFDARLVHRCQQLVGRRHRRVAASA